MYTIMYSYLAFNLPKRQSPQFEFSFFLDHLYLFVSDDMYHIVKYVALKQKLAKRWGALLAAIPGSVVIIIASKTEGLSIAIIFAVSLCARHLIKISNNNKTTLLINERAERFTNYFLTEYCEHMYQEDIHHRQGGQ